MKVDIIIPVYRPDDTFCLLLRKLQEQTFRVHRVILVNTEEELWNQAVSRYPIEEALNELSCPYEIYHISKRYFDHGGTRRFAVSRSEAEVFVCMTQDAMPADRTLIEQLVNALQVEAGDDREIAVSYARQLPAADCGVIERYTRQFNYPPESAVKWREDIDRLGIKTFFCSDVCAAYRRDIYDALGGFEEPAIFNEDMFYAANAIQAGYGVAYAAEARVIHSHNYTASQQFHRNFDLAVSQADHKKFLDGISSESEGIRLVKRTVRYLFHIRKPWLVAKLFVQSAAKYAGYFLGKRYQMLGRRQILRCTMNPEYWRRIWSENR